MRSVSFIILIFLTILLYACNSKQHRNEENAVESAVESVKEEAAEEKAGNTTSEIINDYIKLKDALVASDAKQAKQIAVDMLEVIDAIKMPEIQQNTKEIAATDELSVQRTYFDSLSTNVYQMAKAAQTDIPTLYWQFCPMAFNNQGAHWLSFHKEIKNPYYGDKMMNCGRVEEEIK